MLCFGHTQNQATGREIETMKNTVWGRIALLALAVGLMAMFSMKAANAQSAEETMDYINKKLAECVGGEIKSYGNSITKLEENHVIFHPTGFIELKTDVTGWCMQQGIHLKDAKNQVITGGDNDLWMRLVCAQNVECAYYDNCEAPLLDLAPKPNGGFIEILTCKEKPHVKPKIVKAFNHLLQVWEPEELEELF